MVNIYIKEGWHLNPNPELVKKILDKCERNNGECPCVNPGKTREERMCPCKAYREGNVCRCALYLKD